MMANAMPQALGACVTLPLTGNHRAGRAGLIRAPDCPPVQIRMFELFQESTPTSLAEAERQLNAWKWMGAPAAQAHGS